MSIFKSINIEYNCEKCHFHKEFDDDLKISGIRQEKCENFDIKFIKSVDDDNNKKVEYNCSFKCKKCKQIGNILFDLHKFKKDSYDPINKIYQCCGAKLIINGLLLYDDTDDNHEDNNLMNEKIEMNKKKNNDIINNNENKQVNQIHINNNQNMNNINNNGNGNFNYNQMMNNNMNFMNNINLMNMMNNNKFMMNNNNNINNFNNQFNMNKNDYNNFIGFNGINNGNMNNQLNNNGMAFDNLNNNNNFMGMNAQINNINNMMNNLNLNNNMINMSFNQMPQTQSLKVVIQFGEENNIKIEKNIPLNKKIIEVLREIEKENPQVKEYIDAINKDMLMCGGNWIDCSKSIEELKKDGINLKENCIILVPEKERTVHINY